MTFDIWHWDGENSPSLIAEFPIYRTKSFWKDLKSAIRFFVFKEKLYDNRGWCDVWRTIN